MLEAAVPNAPRGTVAFPRIDVNHGDWVWTDSGPALVAMSRAQEVVPLSRAREYLLNLWSRRHSITDAAGCRAVRRGAEEAIRDVGARLDGATA